MALVLINPVCGNKLAEVFVHSHVRPVLDRAQVKYHVSNTTGTNSAGPIVAAHPDITTVILASGDGTLHELINYTPLKGINVVLIPCGTANALYASLFPGVDTATPQGRLHSLRAFIAQRPTKPLSIARTTLADVSNPINAAVVVSTALHAAILRDSEQLRDQHPGIERFKVAADQNSTVWYNATLTLRGNAQMYSHRTKSFLPCTDPSPVLTGPFAYFLSTVNVDRLEPTFAVTRLAHLIPSETPTCDLIVVRPSRDPLIHRNSTAIRTAFAATTWAVLNAAYQDGAHVKVNYTQITSPEDPTPLVSPVGIFASQLESDVPVVEYLRCSGWDWTPAAGPRGAAARLVCTDGLLRTVPEGVTVKCRVVGGEESTPGVPSIGVYVTHVPTDNN